MQNICQTAGVYPHILQRDGGGEFRAELERWMKEHNIQGITTLSYSPQSNGLIENFNAQMRKMLRELMIRHANLIWYNQLDLCCSIKNKQKNSTTKKRAIDIWNNTPYSKENRNLRVDEAAYNIREKARRDVAKNKTQEYHAGDYVRVKLSQLYSQIRKMIKDGDKKYIVVKYSPEVYIIDKVLKEDNHGLEKKRYTLKKIDGSPLLTQQKMNNPNAPRNQKRFFASDFLPVKKEDVKDNMKDGFDIYKALKLNLVKDEETENNRPPPQPPPPTIEKPVRIRREPQPPLIRKKSTRIRKPNSLLKDYVETNDEGQITKELGRGFVYIGGNKYF